MVVPGCRLRIRKHNSPGTMGNHLLTIAINNYPGELELYNCVADANRLCEVLIQKYGFDRSNVESINNWDVTRNNIKEKLSSFKDSIGEDDNLIIFFSGHGEEDDGIYFFLLYDEVIDYQHSWFSFCEFLHRLGNINCRHLLVILDCCFSGAIFHSSIPRGKKKSGESPMSNAGSELNIQESNFFKSRNKGKGIEIPEDYEAELPSRWGLTATRSGEVASDGEAGKGSPFATALINILNDNEYELSVREIHVILDKELKKGKIRQHVDCKTLNLEGMWEGEFVFIPHKSGKVQWSGTFNDKRDGTEYKTLEIEGTTWLADNLRFEVGTKHALSYENDLDHKKKYGLMYSWKAAFDACPPGWHLPSKTEWGVLIEEFGGPEKAFHKLQKTDINGFNAQLAGICLPAGTFLDMGSEVCYWTSDQLDDEYAYYVNLRKGTIRFVDEMKIAKFYCRYIKN